MYNAIMQCIIYIALFASNAGHFTFKLYKNC